MITVASLAIAATGSFSAWADKVALTELPEAVQKAIKAQSQGETLENVERNTRDGKVVYEAEFKRGGLNRHVQFAADGTVLPSRDLGSIFERKPSMALSDLPAAVQKTVKEQQASRTIADIDKENWNGQTVYEIEFKESGPNSRIHIADDGSIVLNKSGRLGYVGTQLSETPKAVQDTVKRVAADAEIADVDRETKDGKTVYDVEIRKEGRNRHLQIAESGALLDDSETRGTRVRGTDDSGFGRILGADGTTVSFEQLPAAVQRTVKASGDVASLKPIRREMKDGKAQYHVELEKDGKNTRLTIGEDGSLLKDNR
jgi:uncharacterized membrane protein YkoI